MRFEFRFGKKGTKLITYSDRKKNELALETDCLCSCGYKTAVGSQHDMRTLTHR